MFDDYGDEFALVLLEVGVAFALEAEVHPHGDQELDGEVGDLVDLVLEDVEHHRDYAQLYHQHPRLLGEGQPLENAQHWLPAPAVLVRQVEDAHQVLNQLLGLGEVLQPKAVDRHDLHQLQEQPK